MLYTGNSWTTFPNAVPPNYDTSTCSSFVYDESQLVVIGSSGDTAGCIPFYGPKRSGSSSGIGLSLKEGRWQLQWTLPGLNMPIQIPLFTTITSLSKDSLSPASSTCLLDNRFLYAVVRNDTKDKIKKNVHGYVPQEELYVADLQEYIKVTQQKGIVSSVFNWVGSFVSGEKDKLRPFWRPIAEMENCGASITGATTTTTTASNNTHAIYAVGGFTSLSPKFYQVFAAKEKVSCAARMLPLKRNEVSTTDNKRQAQITPTGGWVRLSDMNTRRKHLSTVVVGNYLYAIGGQDEHGKPLASVERLNLALCDSQDVGVAWEPVASLNKARYSFAVTSTEEGVIVVAGGHGTDGILNSVEYLEHAEDDSHHSRVWKHLPNLQTSRMGASLCVMNSKLVVAGGTNSSPGLLWGPSSLDSIETMDILVQESGAARVRQASAPMASVAMLPASPFLEPIGNPPTAPKHRPVVNPERDSEVPRRPVMQPTAPTLEEVEVHQVEQSSITAGQPPMALAHVEEWVPIPDTTDDAHVSPMLPPPLPPALLPPQGMATVVVGDCGSSDGDFTCAVCLERKKQVAFFCGHQTCLQCSPLLSECHICRKPIQGRIQLYGD